MKRRAGYFDKDKGENSLKDSMTKKKKLRLPPEEKANTTASSQTTFLKPQKKVPRIPKKTNISNSPKSSTSSQHTAKSNIDMHLGQQNNKLAKDKSRPNKNIKYDVEMRDLAVSNRADDAIALIYVIVDTNVFLEGGDLKAIDSLIEWLPLPGKTFRRVTVVVPWVVLQELDFLKSNKTRTQKARKAVAFLNNTSAYPAIMTRKFENRYDSYTKTLRRFCSKKPGIRGQTILEAASPIDGLRIEMGDDRILQCCFFFGNLPGYHKTFLYSKDNNLCSKAEVNHIDTASTFTVLVRRITKLCGEKNPEYDRKQFMTSSVQGLNVNNVERAKPEERTKVIDNVPPHVNTIDVEAKASIISVDAEIKASVMETMKEAFSYIVTEEMVNAYGKGLWLDIIIKKPPWSLKDVLFCIKKHWWAVFCGDSTDRLQQDLVDKCLHYLKTSYCPSSRTSNVQGSCDTTFIFCGLQLLIGLGKKYKKVQLIKNSILKLQTTFDNLNSSKALVSPQSGNKNEPQECTDKQDSPSSDGDVVFEDLEENTAVSEEDSVIFWESLDEIWACIIGHSASIFKSLNFEVKTAPPELHSLLFNSSLNDLPDPSISVKFMPLFMELINGFLAALERFLASYDGGFISPNWSLCFDMRQTLWTITKAFNMQSKVENIKPATVLHSCKSTESRTKLCNGFSKLTCVAALLRECSEQLVRMR